jgi:hypothetical protein
MGIAITVIVVAGLVAGFYFIAKRAYTFKRVTALNGFRENEDCPDYIENICRALFDRGVRPGPCFRSGTDSEWGGDAWVVDVDAGGGDDPSQQVFISGRICRDIPDFAMSLTEGFEKIGRIVQIINRLEKPFAGAGFHLLPEPFQPFLQRRKGLAVYAPEEFDIRPFVSPRVLDGLRSGGYGGVACYQERIVVWTYAQAKPDKLFRIARGLLEAFPSSSQRY